MAEDRPEINRQNPSLSESKPNSLNFDSRPDDPNGFDFFPNNRRDLAAYLESSGFLHQYSGANYLSDIPPNRLTTLIAEYFEPWNTKTANLVPPTKEGYIRLFRGERNYDDQYSKTHKIPHGAGKWWSSFLDYAAGYVKKGGKYYGDVYYIDIPEQIAQNAHVLRLGPEELDRASTHPHEFYIDLEHTSQKNKMTTEQIDALLKKGVYSQSGIDDIIEEPAEEDFLHARIRRRLLDLASNELAGFWEAQNRPTENESTGRQEKVVTNVEGAENLLARIMGWR